MQLGLGWKLHGDGSTPRAGDVVRPDERLSWGRTVGLGAQHIVAMFGATFVFPLIMGLSPQLAIMMSGKTNVAPNIATMCCAPRPRVRPHDRRSSGRTTSPTRGVEPSPWSFHPRPSCTAVSLAVRPVRRLGP